MTEGTISWRDYRGASDPQRISLDWIEKNGPFARDEGRNRLCLTGGAGGGGKSYNLRTAALDINLDLRDKGFPSTWGVLICQTYDELVGRHAGEIETEFKGIGTLRKTQSRGWHLRFHGEGLGGVYLRNAVTSNDAKNNKKDKRGFGYQYTLADELTQFTREQFEKIFYNLRSGVALPYNAFLAGSNPDGLGHGWVKEMFVPEYRNNDDDWIKKIGAQSFFYVPIRVEENPNYEQDKEGWEARLWSSDPDIYKARRFGDWDIYHGGRFGKIWNPSVHVFLWPELLRAMGVLVGITPEEFLRDAERWGCEIYASLDYGTSDDSTSAYLLHIVDRNDRLWTFAELPMIGKELEVQAEMILNFEREWGVTPVVRYCDPALMGAPAESKDGIARIVKFQENGVDFIPGNNGRIEGAASVASALYWQTAKTDAGLVWVRRPRARIHAACRNLVAQIPILPRDPSKPEDVHPMGGKWHWYDSYRYMVHTRYQGRDPLQDAVVPYTNEWLRLLGSAVREQGSATTRDSELWNASLRPLTG